MLFGLCLDARRPWADMLRLARHAEESDLAHVYVADHFMPYAGSAIGGPVHECWTVLSALAATTTRIGIGPLVLGNGYRHPAVVANMAATLDQISGGRLLLGLGAGWQPNEHEAYGIDLLTVTARLDRFEEALHVITSLLRSEVSSFDGTYYTLDEARCEPDPVQTPLPILVAGGGEQRSIPLAARFGDAWHAWTTPEQFRHKSAVLDRACVVAGRQPSHVWRLTGQVLRVLARGKPLADESDIVGPASFVAERLAEYQEAGVDEFIVRDHADLPARDAVESLAKLASNVAPALG